MKTIRIIATLFIVTTMMAANAFAGDKNKEVKIKTSAQCEMCKSKIEQALAYEKGVKSAVLDMTTKTVTVVYNSSKTSEEKIRIAISNLGYDADGIAANQEAYQKLPACCKKKSSGCRPGCGGH